MHKLIVFFLLISFISSFSQTKKEELLIKIAEKTCECINEDFISSIKVKVFYKNSECYVPKTKEYYMIKEIIKIDFL